MVFQARHLKVADVYPHPGLPADLHHLRHRLGQGVALPPDVAGEVPAVLPGHSRHKGEVLGGAVALRRVHDAAGEAQCPGLHGVPDIGLRLFPGAPIEGHVAKALGRRGDGPRAAQHPQVQGEGLCRQRAHKVGHLWKKAVPGGLPQARGQKIVQFVPEGGGAGGGGQAAVAHHRRGDPLGQLHPAEIRVVQGRQVAVAVGVDKARAGHPSLAVDGLGVQVPQGGPAHRLEGVPLPEELPPKGRGPGPVHNPDIFHMDHTSIPLAATGIFVSLPSSRR